jgi:hypothetical protein
MYACLRPTLSRRRLQKRRGKSRQLHMLGQARPNSTACQRIDMILPRKSRGPQHGLSVTGFCWHTLPHSVGMVHSPQTVSLHCVLRYCVHMWQPQSPAMPPSSSETGCSRSHHCSARSYMQRPAKDREYRPNSSKFDDTTTSGGDYVPLEWSKRAPIIHSETAHESGPGEYE